METTFLSGIDGTLVDSTLIVKRVLAADRGRAPG
jgi:hypothetical protein